jgi:type I restriction enzyme S subunit
MNRVDEIKGKATGSTFLEIAKRTFRELSIAIPSNILLTAFHEIVIPMISKIRVTEKEIVQLLDARDRLLPQLMSGELKL